jgi:threonine dehydrogenase-like Zn-dependent dehydrogenase
VHAVAKAGITERRARITVIGDGTLGLLVCHILELLGCHNVRIIGRHPSRLALARKFGATSFLSGEIDPAEKSKVVFQAAGSVLALETGLQLLSTNGHMVCLGYVDPTKSGMDPTIINRLIRENQRLSGSFGYSRDSFLEACQGLMAGRFQIAPLISGTISLANTRKNGFDAFVRSTRWAGKLLVSPS